MWGNFYVLVSNIIITPIRLIAIIMPSASSSRNIVRLEPFESAHRELLTIYYQI